MIEQTALGRLLQERREAADYSRVKLAKELGITRYSIEAWELGRIGKPPFHGVMRIASFLAIPFEDLQRAVFADAGNVPDAEEAPVAPVRRRAGRKKRLGAVPLLEAAFRLYGWRDEAEAAEALGATPEQIRSWRRGTELMEIAEYLALTTSVNVALIDALKSKRKTKDAGLAAAAEALGVRPGS